MDVIAEQLKFRACLKILMTELRTLATGFEVDGGKLRFQLYSWLEKEIAAMHKICNYKVSLCLCLALELTLFIVASLSLILLPFFCASTVSVAIRWRGRRRTLRWTAGANG